MWNNCLSSHKNTELYKYKKSDISTGETVNRRQDKKWKHADKYTQYEAAFCNVYT